LPRPRSSDPQSTRRSPSEEYVPLLGARDFTFDVRSDFTSHKQEWTTEDAEIRVIGVSAANSMLLKDVYDRAAFVLPALYEALYGDRKSPKHFRHVQAGRFRAHDHSPNRISSYGLGQMNKLGHALWRKRDVAGFQFLHHQCATTVFWE
jgi:hypothetical protein